jgi:hypothetical protein
MTLPRRKLWAIHDADVEDFLRRLKLFDPIKEGKIVCFQCKQVITLDNFGAAFPEGDEVKVVCEKLECLNPVLKRRGLDSHG